MTTDTPRTDAILANGGSYAMYEDLCRQLERELAAKTPAPEGGTTMTKARITGVAFHRLGTRLYFSDNSWEIFSEKKAIEILWAALNTSQRPCKEERATIAVPREMFQAAMCAVNRDLWTSNREGFEGSAQAMKELHDQMSDLWMASSSGPQKTPT